MDTKTSILKIKKQHANHLFGSKWQSRYFVIDDARQALIQRKDSKEDSKDEQVIPFSDIQSVTILADAPGIALMKPLSESVGNEEEEGGTEEKSAATASAASTSAAGAGDHYSRSMFPSFLSSKSLRFASFAGGGTLGSEPSEKEKKLRTRFVVELKATVAALQGNGEGSNKVILEANGPEEAKEWVRVLTEKVVAPGFNIVKEDITENIRQFYDIHPKDSGASSVLGTGMSGEVRRIKRLSDGKEFAMKVIGLSQMNYAQLQNLQNEIGILKSLDHPNIAKLYEVYVEHGLCVRLVLELCTGGELFDKLSKKRRFSEHYTALLVQKMLSTICYLHTNNIVHRDLKLENWLFRHKEDDDLDVALIDFGLSHKYRTNEHMHALVGTSYYCAPEVLAGDYQGNAVDLWSLGVILYMLLSGSAPFDGDTDEIILHNVKHAKERYPTMSSSFWQSISDEAKDLVRSLLCIDPKERITAEQALKHSWFEIEEANRPQSSLDTDMYESLHKFAKFPELKRVAMEVIAFSLDHDEIKNLKDTFAALDTDGSGYITFPTLMNALKEKHDIQEADAHKIFDALDEDKTGKVHINEFVAACLQEKYHQDERYLFEAFMAMDKGNSGYITVDDLRKLLGKAVSPQRAEGILSEAELIDHHGEHKISYQEFLRFMRSDAEDKMNEARKSLQLPVGITVEDVAAA